MAQHKWSNEEVQAAAEAYLFMLLIEKVKIDKTFEISKKEVRSCFVNGRLSGRTEASFEYRMRNISYVLKDQGHGFISGYIPAENVGNGPRNKILEALRNCAYPVHELGGFERDLLDPLMVKTYLELWTKSQELKQYAFIAGQIQVEDERLRPLETLSLSKKTFNILREKNIWTVGDLLEAPLQIEEEILNAGKTVRVEVEEITRRFQKERLMVEVSAESEVDSSSEIDSPTALKSRLAIRMRKAEEDEPDTPVNLDTPLDVLGLSVRTHNVLRRNGIETVGEFLALDPLEFASFRNAGQKSVDEVVLTQKKLLEKHGSLQESSDATTGETVIPDTPVNLDTPVDVLGLSVRTHNELRRNGIETVGEFLALDPLVFASFRDVGQKSVNEVVLTQLGIDIVFLPVAISIDILGLSVRTHNVLRRNGIETVGEFLALDPLEFALFRDAGQKSVDEVGRIKRAYSKVSAINFSFSLEDLSQEEIFDEEQDEEQFDEIKEFFYEGKSVPAVAALTELTFSEVQSFQEAWLVELYVSKRESYRAIGERLGVTAEAARRRIKRIVDKGERTANSPFDIQIRKLILQDVPLNMIVRRVGCTKQAVIKVRDELISDLRSELTLQEIGDRFSISRERVRQIIDRQGGPSGKDLQKLKAASREQAIQQQYERIRADVLAHPGTTTEGILQRTGESRSVVGQALTNREKKLVINWGFGNKTDDELLETAIEEVKEAQQVLISRQLLPNIAIDALTLSGRVRNILLREKILTIGEFLHLDLKKFASYKGSGQSAVEEVRDVQEVLTQEGLGKILDDPNTEVDILGFSKDTLKVLHKNEIRILDHFFNLNPSDLSYSSTPGALWTKEKIIAVLHQASTLMFPVTSSEYLKLCEVGEIEGPTVATIHKRFGSWVKACEAAGVECGESYITVYNRTWTEDDMYRYVMNYLLEEETTGTFPDMTAYLEKIDGAPSVASLRNYLGGWIDMRAEALTRLIDNGEIVPIRNEKVSDD